MNELIEKNLKDLNIDKSTLGVHVRLTDMNITHARDYGIASIDDYIKAINDLNHKGNIFVASDNDESLIKLKKEFGDKILYIDNMIRGKTEIEHVTQLHLDNVKGKDIWLEAFLDMILLSKCGTLICRSSNLANASIIHADNDYKIIRI